MIIKNGMTHLVGDIIRQLDKFDAEGMIIQCAWCGKSLGRKDGKGVSGVTHGICPECAKKVLEVKK